MKKVVIIGPYTSIGGVSIHIRRLMLLLKEYYVFQIINESPSKSSDSNVLNIREGNVFKYFEAICSAEIAHIHSGIYWLRFIHVLFSKLLFKQVILTIHSYRNKSLSEKILTHLSIFFSNNLIIVSEEIRDALRIREHPILPAFIPPAINNEEKLPEDLIQLIKSKENKQIISANAFQIATFNNEDLYGIDMCIDCARYFRKNKIDAYIIFIIASLQNGKELFSMYSQSIQNEKLEDYIILYPKPISFVRLILKSNIILRPTNTDGDALTIREALYLNKPVIASDVVKRPRGTTLFKTRDFADLINKLESILQHSSKKLHNSSKIDYKEIYRKIYS